MNEIQFARLIHSIYSRNGKLPDLEWIQSLGLLAVKLGQVHALRIDFLEQEKCEHLARLYRRNSPVSASDFRDLLANSGIRGFTDCFSEIDTEPLATASVGQVHRARLTSGEEVVIKAVKGDVREAFRSDIRRLKRLFRLAGFLYPPLRRVGNPVEILEDLEQMTSTELDLENELAGLNRLREIRDQHTREFDLSRLGFPRAYPELSNHNVMVSEFIEAPSVDELLEDRELEYEMLLDLFRLHGYYMFVVGVFHGDLHPGNVLIRDQRFHFIDNAYIGTVSDRLRRGLFGFFEALTRYDYDRCAQALNEMSKARLGGADMDRFRQSFRDLYSDFRDATVSEVSLTARMMQTIKLGVRAGMSFDRGMFGIIRSLMYLDGMVLRCNPDAVLLRDMRSAIDEMLERFPGLAEPTESEAA